jgi:hypothetical protein
MIRALLLALLLIAQHKPEQKCALSGTVIRGAKL